MFAGSHLLTIDDKGRLAIPARFRQQLAEKYGPQVFIARSNQPCVEIYPASEFASIVGQIERLEDRRKADLLTRAIIGNALEAEIDKQGRVLLPPLLRKLAKLESQAVAVGQNKRIEIWSEDIWVEKSGAGQPAAELDDAVALLKR